MIRKLEENDNKKKKQKIAPLIDVLDEHKKDYETILKDLNKSTLELLKKKQSSFQSKQNKKQRKYLYKK